MPTVHLIIKGKVQGVFYRTTAKDKAKELSITGWVQNTPEGNVEIRVSGKQDALDTFIDWCHEGPTIAHVENVEITELEEQSFDEFIIKR